MVLVTTLAALVSSLVAASPGMDASVGGDQPVVVAVLGERGVNVLHDEFARTDPVLRLEGATGVALPALGPFEQRLKELRIGPLGAMVPGVLYAPLGTNIAGIIVPSGSIRARGETYDLTEEMLHGTGVGSAVAGRTVGTNPSATLIFVLGSDEVAWQWAADQPWIDVVTTSVDSFSGPPAEASCSQREAINQLVSTGRTVFAAAGNSASSTSLIIPPAHFPEVYQVGGTDEAGQPWMPTTSDPLRAPLTRPYETGDAYRRALAIDTDGHALAEIEGTSFAAPSTAGRASRLVQVARSLLGSGRTAAAVVAGRARLVPTGPLADGSLSVQDLSDTLHRAAVPAFPLSDGLSSFAIEGYGTLDAPSVHGAATDHLLGHEALPERPSADRDRAMIDQAKEASYAPRCTSQRAALAPSESSSVPGVVEP